MCVCDCYKRRLYGYGLVNIKVLTFDESHLTVGGRSSRKEWRLSGVAVGVEARWRYAAVRWRWRETGGRRGGASDL